MIFKFKHDGKVIEQWAEPAFSGWGAVLIEDPATSISSDRSTPDADFALQGNYPNPFNPTTTIRFTLPIAGFVELSVYDAKGRRVQTLVATSLEAGGHEVPWSALRLATGVYWARLKAGDRIATRKMVFLR